MKIRVALIACLLFSVAVSAGPDAIGGVLPLSVLEEGLLEFTSIQQVQNVFLPDKEGTVSITNSDVDRCFSITYSPAQENGRIAILKFNPFCNVCGKFSVKFLLPSNAEALRNPPEKELLIPCKADVLMVHRGKFPSGPFPGLESYIAKAASEGLTVKFAGVYDNTAPQVSGGRFLGEVVNPSVYTSPNIPLPPHLTFIENNFEARQKYVHSKLAERFSAAIVAIRRDVQPKYVILLGGRDVIPFYLYPGKFAGRANLVRREEGNLQAELIHVEEAYYPSDHPYATISGFASDPNIVVSVSRVPYSPIREREKFEAFFARAALKKEVGSPAILTIRDKFTPQIERRTLEDIVPHYYSETGVCTPPNCFYAPTTCVTDLDPTKFAVACNSVQFKEFLSAGHLYYQGHGTPASMLGPKTSQIIMPQYKATLDAAQLDDLDHTYLVVAHSSDFLNPQYGAGLNGAFLNLQSCRGLDTYDYAVAYTGEYPLTLAAMDAGAVAVSGFSGKSSSTFLPGSQGQAVRLGDDFFNWKLNAKDADQKYKIGLYGDPLLKVRLT